VRDERRLRTSPSSGPRPAGSEDQITTSTATRPYTVAGWQRLAQAHLDGLADDAVVTMLEAHREEWVTALERLLERTDATLARLRETVTGPERPLVLEDFGAERARVAAQLQALTGKDHTRSADEEEPGEPEVEAETTLEPGITQLQLSWTAGQLVAWAAGRGTDAEASEEVLARLSAAGAATGAWQPSKPVSLPEGGTAEALEAPISAALGWLVGLAGTAEDDAFGPSATWLGLVATLAVRLVAQGRMVPQLEKVGGRQGNSGRGAFAVRWAPTLIDRDELEALARALPGAVAVLDGSPPKDAKAYTESIIADLLDAICRDAAARVEVPAPPPEPRSEPAVAEAVLGRLDGTTFEAPQQAGGEVRRKLRSWAKAITGPMAVRLVVQLDPPADDGGWHLRTLTPTGRGRSERVDAAMSKASNARREAIKAELDRLEALYAPLLRTRGTRRGEVVLSAEEAWALMTETGPLLVAAGFEVQVPPLSRRKPAPGLRLTSTEAQESVVGANQLTTVRWSAVFDDVELSAEDIKRLAAEARPLVKAHGQWVELDRADLEAAAAALAERADRTQLTGAEMLRHALGLDGSQLAGGISVAGSSWAADLIGSASRLAEEDLPTRPEGFHGELRHYQAEALAWLRFLERAGLGGILALDMGLGKTPTMLAHLQAVTTEHPALVIVPPAVAGNWAAEARTFTPDLEIVVHHGQNRAEHADFDAVARDADVVITTYGTALRDIGALEQVTWSTVVLDEAQVIKNPLSETAQTLRRLEAHQKVALTGTPIENGLGDLWALLDFTNPGLVGDRATFVSQLSRTGTSRSSAEQALRTLNGVLVFRRTKSEPAIAAELPDRIDVLDHCPLTPEQIGLYQAVLDDLVADTADGDAPPKKGAVLAAITALKQICNHPAAYGDGEGPLDGRSGKLARCEEIVDNVFEADERVLIFTHFAQWGEQLAAHLSERTGQRISCYHGGLSRTERDRMVREFQQGEGAGALVLSLKAGGTGLNLTAASHVVLYDRWWNPAVEDQARDRAWRIGQTKTVVAHRLVCPGTVDERVEEVVAGKRRIADLVLPESSSVDDLHGDQLRAALGLDPDALLTEDTREDAEETAA
jgi:superfamily II DNA or RNA helicase